MHEFPLLIKYDDDSKESAEVWVDGYINGIGSKFILDTGCAVTAFMFNEALENLPVIGEEESLGAIGKIKSDIMMIDSLEIGPLLKNNINVSIGKKGELDRNLLGMNFLKDYCLHFLFDQKKVCILESHQYEKYDLFMDKGSIPYVDVGFENIVASAVWDSGASVTLVDKNFLENNQSLFKEVGISSGIDFTGAKSTTPIFTMNSTSIGNNAFPSHQVVVIDLSHINAKVERRVDMILGYTTLSKANWIFDFQKRKWSISKMNF